MKPEFAICVEGLPEYDRQRFLDGLKNTFCSSKLSFEPPYKWEWRYLTAEEQQALGTATGRSDAAWRQQLRDFAEDGEQHRISSAAWRANRTCGITLYTSPHCFTAYYADAAELYDHEDDNLPMHHVMVKSDPPHRSVIHAIHLAAWVQHLAAVCMPVQIRQFETEGER